MLEAFGVLLCCPKAACQDVTYSLGSSPTHAQVPSLASGPQPQVLTPTPSGYTLQCFGRAIGHQPPTTLGVRVLSYPDLFAGSAAPVTLTGPPPCQELSQACTRRKENILFQYV
jgi:hypothetical protein